MSVEAAPVCYRHTDRESHIRCQRCERPICPDCMRSAAVGFQCPECVREGQRAGRTGRPLSLAARGVPVVTYALIGINALVWLAVLAKPSLVYVLAQHVPNYCTAGDLIAVGSPQSACAAANGTYALGTAHGGWWELVTAMFTHQAVWHIASNMLSLYMIGPLLEQVLGRAKYLAAYLVCGVGASVLVMVAGPQTNFTLGASGAIFGLMGILFVLFLRHGLPMQQLATVLVLNLFITFSVSGISWQGHIGGLLTGLAIGALIAYTPLGRRS